LFIEISIKGELRLLNIREIAAIRPESGTPRTIILASGSSIAVEESYSSIRQRLSTAGQVVIHW